MKAEAEAHGAGILVVDDDANLASTLKEFLTREGYELSRLFRRGSARRPAGKSEARAGTGRSDHAWALTG